MTRLRTLMVALLAALMAAGPALAAPARTSLIAVENDLMCVACHEPLAVAQSPQADRERALILTLVHRGDTKTQIERVMVAQYGPAVLARPPAQGFSLALYIIPPAVVIIGIVILAVTLPRWRRRRAGRLMPASSSLSLTPGEAHRLDEELQRYDG